MSTLLLILSTILWGVWGYVNKRAVDHAHPLTVQWMYYLPTLLFIPILYVLGSRIAPQTNLDGSALRFALISGVAAAIAALLFFFALQTTSASVAVAITASYPVVTLLIGAVMREETITPQKLIGIGIIILGVVVLQWDAS